MPAPSATTMVAVLTSRDRVGFENALDQSIVSQLDPLRPSARLGAHQVLIHQHLNGGLRHSFCFALATPPGKRACAASSVNGVPVRTAGFLIASRAAAALIRFSGTHNLAK